MSGYCGSTMNRELHPKSDSDLKELREYSILLRHPTPKLKCLFANPPTSRELSKLQQVAIEVGEGQRKFVGVEVKLAYFDGNAVC